MAWLQCRSRASGPSYGAGGHKKLAQREVMCAISAKKLAQHAIKRLIWAILPALGEYFRAIANHSRRWANIFAPMLLTAPQDETVDTNAETSGRLHETHDSFVRQNCAENRCIWLALVSSVSPETEHTPAKAMTVSRELPAAVPAGGGKAWPDNKPTRRATHQRPGAAGVEGAGGTGGHGRASTSTTPSRRLACGDLTGGRARRRPEHQQSRKQQAQSQIPAAPLVWRVPVGPDGTAVVRRHGCAWPKGTWVRVRARVCATWALPAPLRPRHAGRTRAHLGLSGAVEP